MANHEDLKKAESIIEAKSVIKGIITQNMLKSGDINEDDDFTDDLQMDSLTKMELLMSLEDHFGIKIDDADVVQLTSIRKTAEFIINSKLSGVEKK